MGWIELHTHNVASGVRGTSIIPITLTVQLWKLGNERFPKSRGQVFLGQLQFFSPSSTWEVTSKQIPCKVNNQALIPKHLSLSIYPAIATSYQYVHTNARLLEKHDYLPRVFPAASLLTITCTIDYGASLSPLPSSSKTAH